MNYSCFIAYCENAYSLPARNYIQLVFMDTFYIFFTQPAAICLILTSNRQTEGKVLGQPSFMYETVYDDASRLYLPSSNLFTSICKQMAEIANHEVDILAYFMQKLVCYEGSACCAVFMNISRYL